MSVKSPKHQNPKRRKSKLGDPFNRGFRGYRGKAKAILAIRAIGAIRGH